MIGVGDNQPILFGDENAGRAVERVLRPIGKGERADGPRHLKIPVQQDDTVIAGVRNGNKAPLLVHHHVARVFQKRLSKRRDFFSGQVGVRRYLDAAVIRKHVGFIGGSAADTVIVPHSTARSRRNSIPIFSLFIVPS